MNRNTAKKSFLGQIFHRRKVDFIFPIIKKFFLPPYTSEELSLLPLTESTFATNRDYIIWFINLRWVACFISGLLVFLNVFFFKYLAVDTLFPLVTFLILLVVSNLFYIYCLDKRWLASHLASIQIVNDLIILTGLLHYSGGIENPLSFAYIFHVIISGIILKRYQCYLIVFLSTVFFILLAVSEMEGWIEHYTLQLFSHTERDGAVHHAAMNQLHVQSRIGLHFIMISLTAFFTTSIMDRLRVAEKRAMSDRQRLERVIQATEVGLIIIDSKFRVEYLNEYSNIWSPFFDGNSKISLSNLEKWLTVSNPTLSATFTDGKIRFEERQMRSYEDKMYTYEVILAPLFDQEGAVYQLAILIQDITQRKLIEAEFMHSAKMAVIGQMAAGVAHEVGNPLSSISARLTLMEEFPDDVQVVESISLLKKQIMRIERIVGGISHFSRPTTGYWETFDVNQILLETIEILKLHIKSKAYEIQFDQGANLPLSSGIKDQMVQVFLNIGLNAFEAMLETGILNIRSYTSVDGIGIDFSDSGEGISDENMDHIYNPFFTTKKSGLGIGLSIVYQIINAHGAKIDVERKRGEGTCFKITLPIRET